ncbi:MAG: respiratory nitrate reductase subunit gamma [Nitrososphaerales archaeon]
MSALVRAFFSELWNRVFLQKDIINNDRVRRFTHLTMFWGFLGLGITSALDYAFNQQGNYIPIFGSNLSGIRFLGNFAGVVMMIGATIAVVRLVTVHKYRTNRNLGDIWFTCLLFIAGLSGFITEYCGEIAYAANPSALPAAAYSISFSASLLISIPYGFHLASIALIFLTAPISFFMHALHVPSMRYMERLGMLVSMKRRSGQKSELLRSKESAMLDQVQEIYEQKKPE